MRTFSSDIDAIQYAIEIAKQGRGRVEPNPMVGALIVSPSGHLIAEGIHERFGEAHAEINALRQAGQAVAGADLYVTLEPCSHFGKTPPCCDAVTAAGVRRVIIGCADPAPHTAGRGIARLKEAGIEVICGVCEADAQRLIAPFRRLMCDQRPWVHAKWAMTLDGRVASRNGHSKWISCEASRSVVHDLRAQMDAIVTGAGTVVADDPLLTARPQGNRTALRVVLDSFGRSLEPSRQLVSTAREVPVLACVAADCPVAVQSRLESQGVSVFRSQTLGRVDLLDVLQELGRRQCTNLLIEAGPGVLGEFFDQQRIDEVHVFVCPKMIGGAGAQGPVGGLGGDSMAAVMRVKNRSVRFVGDDLLIEGDTDWPEAET